MTDHLPSIRDLFDRHPWHVALPRLRRYARERAARLVWSGFRRGPLPAGRQPEDVVGVVIEKVLSGVRTWDPVRNPDLDAFLESVVDSELSHLVESWEHRHVRTAAAFSAPEQLGQEIGQGSSSADGPLEKAVAGEEAIRRAEFFDSFHASLADDPVLQGIVACIHEDVVKPGEIAVRLGIPVTEIYNRRKQLQRRLTAFYADWNRARPADDWQPGRTSWRMTK